MATVFAVFSSSDNSLTFYNRNTVPSAGATFEGKTVTNVYTGFEAKTYANPTLVPWYSKRSRVHSVSFADEVAPTSLKFWFMDMNNLASFDGKKLNTANVTTMQGAFQMCSALQEIDVSGWGSDKLTSTQNMFYYCTALSKIKLDGFVFSSVTNASQMFYGCPVQTLDLSSFDTSGLVTADSMFSYCGYLETIYVSDKWTMAAVTSSSYMFAECVSLRGDIPYDAAKTDATYATYEGGYLTYKVFVPAEFQKDFLIRGETVFGIAEAIRAKTGTAAGLDPDEEMAAAIRGIETGVQLPVLTNPASADDIASGKEAIDGEGNVLTGTAAGGLAVEASYHSGGGDIPISSVTSAPGFLVASDIIINGVQNSGVLLQYPYMIIHASTGCVMGAYNAADGNFTFVPVWGSVTLPGTGSIPIIMVKSL